MARMRAARCAGPTTTWSPADRPPPVSVPVTTVPLPLAAKTRSTQSRGRVRSGAPGVRTTRSSSARLRRSSPCASRAAHGHHRRPVEERGRDVVVHVEGGQLQPLGVHGVRLGERDHTVPDAEQLEDAEVLLALGLPAFGGGDHEQAGVDGAHAGQHVAKETNVAGNVDEADAGARRQHGVSEAEIDREPAALLFLEAIRVGARQGQHQGGLAVIDVAGGRHHPHGAGSDASAATTRASSAGSTVRRSRKVRRSRTLAMIGGSAWRSSAERSPSTTTP